MGNSKEETVEVIQYKGTDLPSDYYRDLIRNRWIRSYKRENDFMKMTYPPSYYSAYNKYVPGILKRPRTMVKVATLGSDRDIVLGFSVFEDNILHYIHVPKSYRKKGIGRALFPQSAEFFSHLTKIGLKIWAEKRPDLHFDPFA